MQVIQSIRQLEAARDEWNALADRTGQALLRHDWFYSAASTLCADGDLAVLSFKRNGHVVAIAPLANGSKSGIARLEFIGASALHEPGGFLYEDEPALAELIDGVFALRRPLMLQRLPQRATELMGSRRDKHGPGWLIARPTARALGIPFGAGSAFAAGLSGRLRYDLKRARSRAAERGKLSFEVEVPAPRDVDGLMDRLVAVEASGWKGRRKSSLAANPRLQAFFRMYARLAAESGSVRFFFLRLGNTTAAVQMAVEVYERLWVLKIGYDETVARCSPGLLLTAEAIEYASRRGLRSYEFLGSAEPWEERWGTEPRDFALVAFYPLTLRGWLGASLDVVEAVRQRATAAARMTIGRTT